MNFAEIKKKIKQKDYLVSEHADEKRTKDKLSIEEIEITIISGEVIEERLDDPRGESRLIAGKTSHNKWVHSVVGVKFGRLVLVTVYLPSER